MPSSVMPQPPSAPPTGGNGVTPPDVAHLISNGRHQNPRPDHALRSPRTREGTIGHIADRASYWLVSASIYFTFGLLFFFSAKEKLIDNSGTMPAPLAKTFQGTFVASFPGTNTSWVLIGLLEALVFVVIAASVLTGEFLPTRRKPILLSGLALSMFTFAMIAWGENLTGGFATVAELFEYLVGTAVLIVLVLLMPPYRKTQWLSGLLNREQEQS